MQMLSWSGKCFQSGHFLPDHSPGTIIMQNGIINFSDNAYHHTHKKMMPGLTINSYINWLDYGENSLNISALRL